MDQSIINIIIGTVLSVLGWFARQLWDAVQGLKSDMQKIEISLPTHYVRKDELEARFDKIELMLDKISEKLDHKVDK
jgi:predicted amidophosphoribosyltransferase